MTAIRNRPEHKENDMSENQTDDPRGPVIPKPVTDALREAMASATFKADTMQQFTELAQKVESLERTNEYLRGENAKLESENHRLRNDVMKAEAKVDEIGDRERACAEREAKISELEKDAAVAKAVSGELRSVFHVIFANNQVRRQVTRNVSHPPAKEYGSLQYATDSEDVTETEGPA